MPPSRASTPRLLVHEFAAQRALVQPPRQLVAEADEHALPDGDAIDAVSRPHPAFRRRRSSRNCSNSGPTCMDALHVDAQPAAGVHDCSRPYRRSARRASKGRNPIRAPPQRDRHAPPACACRRSRRRKFRPCVRAAIKRDGPHAAVLLRRRGTFGRSADASGTAACAGPPR